MDSNDLRKHLRPLGDFELWVAEHVETLLGCKEGIVTRLSLPAQFEIATYEEIKGLEFISVSSGRVGIVP